MALLRRFLLAFTLLLFVLPNAPAASPDAEFEKVADDYIKGWLAAHPIRATQLGIHEYDGRVTDFTRLAIDAERARLKRFEERLARFDPEKLSPEARIDLQILKAAVDRELFQIDDLNAFEMNPMIYAQALDVNVFISRDFAPLDDRVSSIVTIINQAPNIVIAAKTNLAQVLPRPLVETAIQIARGSAEFMKNDLAEAVKPMKDDRVRISFRLANRKAVAALNDYASWLEKERLPKATAEWALGPEKYQRMLAKGELVDIPPARILEIGLAELKRQQAAFAEAARTIDPSKPAHEVFKEIQKEHPTAATLVEETAKNLNAIRQFVVAKDLVSIPSKVTAKVQETPQYLRATSFASMDTPGPFEKKAKEAYYYVTPVEAAWPDAQKEEWLTAFNYYTTDVVSIHEVYPGHYTQFLHLNKSDASKVRKIFESYGFVEGWAHYTEEMVIDAGYGTTASDATPAPADDALRAAKYRMAQISEALLRLCRLVVSIRMHTEGMTVEEGTRFFQENAYYEEKPARAEAMRGTYDPGYLNYTLGKLQFQKLRADYEKQEGDKFSAKEFHNEVLSHGMPPIRLLRQIMLKDEAIWGDVL